MGSQNNRVEICRFVRSLPRGNPVAVAVVLVSVRQEDANQSRNLDALVVCVSCQLVEGCPKICAEDLMVGVVHPVVLLILRKVSIPPSDILPISPPFPGSMDVAFQESA